MFAPLASRQVAIIARSSNLRPIFFPVQAMFQPSQTMMFSTTAVRKDIDSAAKYIGAGFCCFLVLLTFNLKGLLLQVLLVRGLELEMFLDRWYFLF